VKEAYSEGAHRESPKEISMPSKVKDASILRNKSQKHNPVSNQVQASPRQVEQIALESDRAEQKEQQAHVT
jgi:hypothetical protein